MSFAAIRSTATSALTASQVRMQVAASNIANADTAGYTQKIASASATSTGQLGAGVEVSSVTSAADKYLIKDIVKALTALGSATVTDSYAQSLQSLFGTISGDDSSTSLANSIVSVETALAQLAGTPESDTLKAVAVDALNALAGDIRTAAIGIQSLRGNADSSIADSVATVNEQLNTIDSLNSQIKLAAARGESTADLEDQRTVALQAIASEMNVTYYVTSDNQMKVSTASGTALLDSSVHELNYIASGYVTTDTVFSGITVGGKDITSAITSGAIGALIEQRDTVLPAAQAELDALASAMIDAVNSVYNQGTALPAPSSLTSSDAVDATDALSGTGTVRIAVIEDDGSLVSYGDFDLSAYATVGDFVDAVNATTGLSAAIGADGRLLISATDGNGVAVADIDSTIDGQGVSDYFGFNDLLTGDSALNIAVRSDLATTPGLLATATLSTDTTLTVGKTAVGVSSALATSLKTALTGDTSFSAAGTLKAQNTTFADYATLITAGVASKASSASAALTSKDTAYQTLANTFSSQTGVNVDEETARVSELEQQYSTAAQLLQVLNTMFDALLAAVK